jgi:hypothetical protein
MDEDNDGRFPDKQHCGGPLPAIEAAGAGRPVGVAVAAWLDSRAVRPGRVVRVRGGPRAGRAAGRAARTARDGQPEPVLPVLLPGQLGDPAADGTQRGGVRYLLRRDGPVTAPAGPPPRRSGVSPGAEAGNVSVAHARIMWARGPRHSLDPAA